MLRLLLACVVVVLSTAAPAHAIPSADAIAAELEKFLAIRRSADDDPIV